VRRASADPLPIRSVEFMGGMAQPGGWRPESNLPEIAFSGRSNVGKSSLLNSLVRRKSMARVSNTPGRTREVNFFRVNERFVLADLPGYGYAKVSKEEKAKWKPLIESYLTTSPQLRGIVQLIDIRHDPTTDDLQMLDWLAALGAPALIVATKADKVSTSALATRVGQLSSLLGLAPDAILPHSSTTGAGRDELAEALLDLIEREPWRAAREAPEAQSAP
jgi:GTP-binding protein